MRRKEDVMIEIIFAFSVRNCTQLSCVWIETGNPERPLTCRWVVPRQFVAAPPSASAAKTQTNRLCA